MTEPLRCYRHPDRETFVSCTECGRGICPDCMTFGPVGIRCPDHARTGGRQAAPRRTARRARLRIERYGSFVTLGLIGINVGIYLLQLMMGSGINGNAGWIWEHGSLVVQTDFTYGRGGLAEGEWWRLVTSAFLHYGPLHLGMNMLVLWIIGPALEEYFGHVRFAFLYLVSGLAGAAGAVTIGSLDHLFDPPENATTVGASGAIWGIMGAALLLEARGIYVFGGQAMGLVVFNLAISVLLPGISIGGHVGGLIGGALVTLAFTSIRRRPALVALAIGLIAALSVAVALSQA